MIMRPKTKKHLATGLLLKLIKKHNERFDGDLGWFTAMVLKLKQVSSVQSFRPSQKIVVCQSAMNLDTILNYVVEL